MNNARKGLVRGMLAGCTVCAMVGISFFAATPGQAGAPLRCGGEAATMVGTRGADTLTGTDGHDVIVALGGNDIIVGLGGADRVSLAPVMTS